MKADRILEPEDEPSVWLELTGCCALTQLRCVGAWKPKEIDLALEYQRQTLSKKRNPRKGNDGGAPTLFCMTVMPFESRLAEELAKRGFKKTLQIPRRKGYPAGWIDMWTITLMEDDSTDEALKEFYQSLEKGGEG